jgi:predicted enzyme related to lactoylglutathione lyase
MPRVVHFEIHADDPDRAAKFYQTVLGWQFQKWDGPADYWLVTTGPKDRPGIDGGLLRRQPGQGGNAVIAYVCTVDVPSVDAYVDKATAAGGTVAMPKMPVPGVGWLAYCKDSEGNLFGMMQADSNAR